MHSIWSKCILESTTFNLYCSRLIKDCCSCSINPSYIKGNCYVACFINLCQSYCKNINVTSIFPNHCIYSISCYVCIICNCSVWFTLQNGIFQCSNISFKFTHCGIIYNSGVKMLKPIYSFCPMYNRKPGEHFYLLRGWWRSANSCRVSSHIIFYITCFNKGCIWHQIIVFFS